MIIFLLFPFLINCILSETTTLIVERYNYASFDCAARVLATSAGTKSAWAILQPQNRDAYLTFLCAAPSKYVIVELCADIRLDTIVLANTEYFSSVFKEFRLWGGKKFPVDADWLDLGSFTAQNTRQEQHFVIQKVTSGYIRFLKIEFLAHYGAEYICPVSLLKAFGKTMMEDFVDEKRLVDQVQPEPVQPIVGTQLFVLPAAEECKVREENVFKAINERLNAFERQVALLARERPTTRIQRHLCIQNQPQTHAQFLVYASLALSCLSLTLMISLFSRMNQLKGVMHQLPKKETTASPSTPGGVVLEDSTPELVHHAVTSPLPSRLHGKRSSAHTNKSSL